MISSNIAVQSFSIAEYCVANANRVFNGLSHGSIDLPVEVKGKREVRIYRDADGQTFTKKALSKILGISESTIGRIFADHYYDHIAVHKYLASKPSAKVNKIENIYLFDSGEITDSVTLAEYYGVARQFVSKKYFECDNEHLAANQLILKHSNKLKERKRLKVKW
jgi:DNA-binding XRE family transcriptional regulator